MSSWETVAIHRAAWVHPMSGPPIPDGAVAVAGDRVLAVGSWRAVDRDLSGRNPVWVDHGEAALLPGLVNVHTHLDFSLMDLPMPESPRGFPGWVREILARRGDLGPQARRRARMAGRRELAACGTAVYADVVNPPLDGAEMPDSAFPVELRWVEVLGFHIGTLEEAGVADPDLPGPERAGAPCRSGPWAHSLAAHSLYAASPDLIREAKAWTRRRGLPFSIHVAEHGEEVEFVAEGTGFCRTLLESLGRWNRGWRPFRSSPVAALEALGVLDEATILVHAVHLDAGDWDRVARAGSAVCFCPRSNRFIGGRLPDMAEALKRGIRVCLGTDSRASNEDLNLFREAAYGLSRLDGATPEGILSMITLNGARALGIENEWGRLGPGAAVPFLRVDLGGTVRWERDVAEGVVYRGAEGHLRWVTSECRG